MKNIAYLIISLMMLAVSATSCKTTEENYKAAYDIAARKQVGGVSRDVSAFIEREKRLGERKLIMGDSVRVLTQRVKMVEGDDTSIHNYCVVVGDFKQVFNASSFSKRINDVEKDTITPSYVVVNPEKRYYVIYKGFNTKEEAAVFLMNRDNFKIRIPIEEPWILEKQ